MTDYKATIIAIIVSFGISAVLGPVVIPFLRKLKMGQTERKEGVQAHLKKAGTPTMGGVIFLAAILITSVFFIGKYPKIVPVLILTLGFGAIGFLDDYLKVVLRRSDGLLAWQKLLLQFVVTAVYAFCMLKFTDVSLDIRIPWGETVSLPMWVSIPLLFFVVIGTVNGVNFTDGVDGLASSVTTVVAGFFILASLLLGGQVDPVCGAVMGGLMGFLLYNCYPAKIFMGDTGSLALGGFVAGTAYMLGMPLFILIIGFIYLIEVVSVILQVGYFKLTHGKRIFKMAPIHHHFELSGWSETKVVAVFTIVTGILCLIGLLAI